MPTFLVVVVGVLLTAAPAAAQTQPSAVTPPGVVSSTATITEPLFVDITEGTAVMGRSYNFSGPYATGVGVAGLGSVGVSGSGSQSGGSFSSYYGNGVDILSAYGGGLVSSGGRVGADATCWLADCAAVIGKVSRSGGPFAGGPGSGTGVYGDGGMYGVYGVADDTALVGHKTYAGFFDGNVHVRGEFDAPIITQLQAQIANLTARLAALEGSTPRGTPVPARLQAEDYDQGGQGVGYSDTTSGNLGGAYRPTDDVDIKVSSEGGFAVGWIMNGEWLAYTVNVPTASAYTLTARVGSPMSGRAFRITVDGIDVTGVKAVPQTANWDQYGNVSSSVQLQAGTHVLRFVPATDWIDFQWLEVTRP